MEVTSICGEEVQNEGQQSSISTSQNMSMNIHYCEPSVKVVDNFLLPPKESSDFLTGKNI